jgi:hypothetical protein
MSINLTVSESDAQSLVPEGMFRANLKEIKEGHGEFGDYIQFSFEITEGEQKGKVLNSLASKKLTRSDSGKNSKIFDFVKALTRTEPRAGENLDLEELIGNACQILVRHKIKDGTTYSQISTVVPS